MAETTPKPWGETKVVGKPLPRVDAFERLSGKAVYTLDLILPDMLYAATLRCPFPRARVKRLDLSKALKMPGVRAVLSDADPEAKLPWYSGPGGKAMSRLFDPECRYEGEEVAVVAAESPQQAWDAVKAIEVEYERLPFVSGMEEAVKEGAPAIFEGGNYAAATTKYSRGDVDKGFAEADVVLEETYRTSCEIHTTMEVHCSVAKWDGDQVTVWDTTQGVFAVQSSLASLLNMPISKVRVIGHYMGGGFGSKLGLNKHTVSAVLLAKKTRRPVKIALTREETFLCVGNRPAHVMRVKAGVKKDGTLTALDLYAVGEIGAYPGSDTVGYQFQDLYRCPNVRIIEQHARTNTGPSRPFRAPGMPQGSWALEQILDALAEKIGMDPVELRLKNVSMVCQVENNRPYTSNGLPQCLTEGAKAFGWQQARTRPRGSGHIVRGVGVAAGMWRSPGGPPSTALVYFYPDGSVNLNMGAADIGTGTKTVMAMVVAEELDMPLDRITVENADTGTTQYTGPSGGSKTVMADSPAVRAAAIDVRNKLLAMAAQQLKIPAENLTLSNGVIYGPGGSPKLPVSQLAALQSARVVVGVGTRGPNIATKSIRPFAAHFAEVEVNKLTGEVRVLRMVAAQDSGRVMNLLTFRNQVIGGLTMGIGFALTERRIIDAATGKVTNDNWHDYKIPTAKDVPADLALVPVDLQDHEACSTSTKGLGEPATIPAAAAIANAFYHATGVRITSAPMTPAQVLALLGGQKKQG